MTTPRFRVSVLSKVGGRERNEDACGYWADADSPLACYVLADGAGGHGGGDVASRVAVQTVLEQYANRPVASHQSVMTLLTQANDAVIKRQSSERRLADMRSTLVVLQVDASQQQAFWGHVGDSRLYCFRQGKISQRTKDHSLVQNMVDAGVLRADSHGASADRNVLTGSIGGDDCFSPSAIEQPYHVDEGSAFLLCSDGFWGVLEDRQMEQSLHNADTPEAWLKDMELAFTASLRPGADNYSAIALWYGDDNERTRFIQADSNSLLGASS